MKNLITYTFLILLYGCSENPHVLDMQAKPKSIENLCSGIELGISIEESDLIMKGIGRFKLENTKGEKSGSGYIQYWDPPTDVEKILKEPMRAVIPHKETCLVKFDKYKNTYEVSFSFISEDSYQEQLRKSQ